jgi:hypothetical protein
VAVIVVIGTGIAIVAALSASANRRAGFRPARGLRGHLRLSAPCRPVEER